MSAYCNAWCSRPATEEERREDTRKRIDAIEEAESRGTHSPAQIASAWKALDTFTGYLRCTRGSE